MKITAKKSFGQNWLHDDYTLDLIVSSANISSEDTVLEVGPGLGTLTQKLIDRAKTVVTVEADQDLIPILESKFNVSSRPGLEGDIRPGLELIMGDILKFNLTSLPKGYKVVANIPYYLTSNLIRILLESQNPPKSLTLLIQKEVAERIVAKPGQMSVLAFSVQYYAQATIIRDVSRELFDPVPKVDSSIIQIDLKKQPSFPADSKKLFQLVKAGFSQKRKKLTNALAGGLHISQDQALCLVREAGLKDSVRAQELSLSDWQSLYEQF